jgi:hypothetical protein
MDKVCVGMSVNIQRSNGRMQSAMVTKLNHKTGQVAVEWMELVCWAWGHLTPLLNTEILG